ncbi:hypothetical protein ABZV58_18095 [Nocardia sp. NPDC004654]|uniref:hypothetical protein n=1 Tax=Nocardia sp. NPDC004654 TaxID=3154776 RepID=UPI0033B53468
MATDLAGASMTPDVVRIGQWQTPSPEWLPPGCRDLINDTAAGLEAQVATALDSIGIPAGRSDRVSGATVAGAGIGGALGAVAAGAPVGAAAAVVGELIGGTKRRGWKVDSGVMVMAEIEAAWWKAG